jgi:hypothetical protein
MAKVDPRVQNYKFDVETDRKVQERLSDMGINKPDDLLPGRADIGLIAEGMGGTDVEVAPLIAEKVVRDRQFAQMAEDQGQEPQDAVVPDAPAADPAAVAATSDPDALTLAQQQLAEAQQEAERWKKQYGERENKLGDERRRMAERLARLEQAQQPAQAQYAPPQQYGAYDPRLLGNRDPDTPMTAAEVAALMQAQSVALGAQLQAKEAQFMETMRHMRGFDVTPDEEVTLLERHPWLATIDQASKMDALRSLVEPLRASAQAQTQPTNSGAATPRTPSMEDIARARVRTATTFIEPSTQGSAQEGAAIGLRDDALAKKAARLKELLNTPGGSISGEAEKLVNELAGRRT